MCFDYSNTVINVDSDSLVWSVSKLDSTNFVGSIDSLGEMCVFLTSSIDFVDSILIVVQEYGTVEMYSDSSWQIINYSTDNAPILSGIQNQTIC